MKILDAQLAKTTFVAGNSLSMGDIPVALMAYRFRRLVPERSGLDNLERWFRGIEQRPAFKEHVLAVPFV
jgi:glutathione S-transferase